MQIAERESKREVNGRRLSLDGGKYTSKIIIAGAGSTPLHIHSALDSYLNSREICSHAFVASHFV